MMAKYIVCILSLILVLSCKTIIQPDEIYTKKLSVQNTLGFDYFFQGKLYLLDHERFSLDVQKFGYQRYNCHYRIFGKYEINGRKILFNPFDCDTILRLKIIDFQNSEHTQIEVDLIGPFGFAEYKSPFINTQNFSNTYGKLFYSVDKGDWHEINLGNQYSSKLDTKSLTGDTVQFKFEFNGEWNVPAPVLKEVIFSLNYSISEVVNKKIVIQYSSYQKGCVELSNFEGEIMKNGIKIEVRDSTDYSGYYTFR